MFKKFLYYFLTEDGKSYHVDNKIVKTSAIPKPLENTPDGWMDMSIGYERDMRKLGIVRTFTLPLSAVRKIKQILRTIVFTKNIEEKVYLLIQKLSVTVTSPTTYKSIYNYLYKGQIDLSNYRYEDILDKFTVTEAGTYQQVKANESTTYELDIDNDPEAIRLKMDGMNLSDKGSYLAGEGVEVSNKVFGNFWFAPVSFVNSEGKSSNIGFLSQFVQNANFGTTPFEDILKSENCILQAKADNTVPVEVRISGTIKYRVVKNDPGGVFRMRFATSTQTISNQNAYEISGFGSTVDQIYSVPVDVTIPLQPDEKLFLHGIYGSMPTGAIELSIEFLNGSKLEFNYSGKFRTTYINALKLSTVLKRLTKFITGSEDNCITTYVEQFDHLVLTSGDAIRGLSGAKLKTTLSNFTDFMRVVTGAGQGIENNKLLFQQYGYFYSPDNPIPLGEVSNLKCYPANDLMGNTLKIGYPVQQIDDVNGKSSFNNTHIYSSTKTTTVKELNYVCPYISDPYYTEITRINLEGKTTTDDKADNEVFILNTIIEQKGLSVRFGEFLGGYNMVIPGRADLVEYFTAGSIFSIAGTNAGNYKTIGAFASGSDLLIFIDTVFLTISPDQISVDVIFGTRLLRRVSYTQISGIPDTEFIFNIEDLTPKRLMLLQANMLNSLFYGLAGQKLKFETTEKNADLVTQRGSVIIKEKADYTIGTDILFKPWYFEFDTRVPLALIELLEANINRCFSFVWYGHIYKGFLAKAGTSPNDNRTQSFKLLCTPDTDLTNLILTHG